MGNDANGPVTKAGRGRKFNRGNRVSVIFDRQAELYGVCTIDAFRFNEEKDCFFYKIKEEDNIMFQNQTHWHAEEDLRRVTDQEEVEVAPKNNVQDIPKLNQNFLQKIQAEHVVWEHENFGEGEVWHSILGLTEEVGELCHAYLKDTQGIRTNEDHGDKLKDAAGDIVIYLVSFCNKMNFDLSDIIQVVWDSVKKRDWNKNKVDGGRDREVA